METTFTVSEIYKESEGRYGSYKIAAALEEQGIYTSRNRVARIMQSEGLCSIVNRKYRDCTSDSNHTNSITLNILDRQFDPESPSKVWVSDITYINTDQGWLYLTTVIDLFDRKVIGWSLSSDMTTENTIIKAWKMAIVNRDPKAGMIFHSDRGVQYTSKSFRRMLQGQGVVQSMSRKGNCWDNVVVEAFFKILKSELTDHKHYFARFQARLDIVHYIEVWYNRKIIHASLGYKTPEVYGKLYNINVA